MYVFVLLTLETDWSILCTVVDCLLCLWACTRLGLLIKVGHTDIVIIIITIITKLCLYADSARGKNSFLFAIHCTGIRFVHYCTLKLRPLLMLSTGVFVRIRGRIPLFYHKLRSEAERIVTQIMNTLGKYQRSSTFFHQIEIYRFYFEWKKSKSNQIMSTPRGKFFFLVWFPSSNEAGLTKMAARETSLSNKNKWAVRIIVRLLLNPGKREVRWAVCCVQGCVWTSFWVS